MEHRTCPPDIISPQTSRLANCHGFSLIETLVSISIMGFIALGIGSLLQQQQKEIKALHEKTDIFELRTQTMLSFRNADVCTWQLNGKVLDVSSTTSTVASPTTLTLPELRQGTTPGTGLLLAKENEILPNSTNNIRVSRILFKDIFATGVSNEYRGVFEIQFLPSSLVRSVKPIQVQQTFRTLASDPLNAKKIDTCTNSSMLVDCLTAEQVGVESSPFPDFTLIDRGINNVPDVDKGLYFQRFVYGEFPGQPVAWGIACRPGWTAISCNMYGSNGNMTRKQVPATSQHGCFGGASEGHDHMGIQLTCCRQ